MMSLARTWPSPPWRQGRPPKVVTRSGRTVAGAQSSRGTVGQLCEWPRLGRAVILGDHLRLPEELGRGPGGLLRGGVGGLRLDRVQAFLEGVGVADVVAEPFAAEPDDQAVLADRLDQGLDPLDPHARPQLL